MVKYLLDSNAKPDKKDVSGNTPLIYACSSGHHEVAALLLQVRVPTAQELLTLVSDGHLVSWQAPGSALKTSEGGQASCLLL